MAVVIKGYLIQAQDAKKDSKVKDSKVRQELRIPFLFCIGVIRKASLGRYLFFVSPFLCTGVRRILQGSGFR